MDLKNKYNSTQQKLENIKRDNYNFDFGDLLGLTFDNYKKIWSLQGAIMLVLLIVLTVVFGSVGAMAIGIGNLTDFFTNYQLNEKSTYFLLIQMLVSIIFAGLLSPLTAGLLQICHQAETNKNYTFSTVFDHYKTNYVRDIITASIIIAFFGAGLQTFFELLKENLEISGALSIIFGIIVVIISIITPLLTIFTIPLIIFGNLNAIDAIKGSILLFSKRYWTILFLVIVIFVCIILSVFAFCIGIFFTIPIWYSMCYIMYRTAVGIDETSEMDEIGSSDF